MKSKRVSSYLPSRTVSPSSVISRAPIESIIPSSRTMSAGSEITRTARGSNRDVSIYSGPYSVRESTEDIEMPDVDEEPSTFVTGRKFIIAIDYGTTFSAVSYTIIRPGKNQEIHSNISSIKRFPGDDQQYGILAVQVPTELWYLDKTSWPISPTFQSSRPIDPMALLNMKAASDYPTMEQPIPDDHVMEVPIVAIPKALWGYQVQKALSGEGEHVVNPEEAKQWHIKLAKLLLEISEKTEDARATLAPTLAFLKEKYIIQKDEDVIIDFLTYLLTHVKEQLELAHGFNADSDEDVVEFVICVPPMWNEKASLKMTQALESAASKSGFKISNSGTNSGTLTNLFVVSEPEAAATWFLDNARIENEIENNETFILIDAGGGTVDAITYTVDRVNPLRLKPDLVKEEGKLCGSSFINQAFRKLAIETLESKEYLGFGGRDLLKVIEGNEIMVRFERDKKGLDLFHRYDATVGRSYNFNSGTNRKTNAMMGRRWELTYFTLWTLFQPSVQPVIELLRSQLDAIKANNRESYTVKKVVLMGGYSESPTLREFIKYFLEDNLDMYGNVKLVVPNLDGGMAVSVSSGAVLRALNKDHGPPRATRLSYGLVRLVHYNPKTCEAHSGLAEEFIYRSPIDGKRYVRSIEWVIIKGTSLKSDETRDVELRHIWDLDESNFICGETLFVSSSCTESNYPEEHEKNLDKEECGRFTISLAWMKEARRLNKTRQPKRKSHYEVNYKLIFKVIDRNLFWHVVLTDNGEELAGSRGQLSLAAAFVPGTK